MDYDISQYARGINDTATTSLYGSDASVTLLAGIMAFLATYMIVILVIAILQIIGMWRIYTKAGQKGWKSLIPIYNIIVMYKICGISPWWIFIFLAGIIPFVGWIAVIAFNIYQNTCLAKSYGKGAGFAVGLIFLQPIFLLILGFGSANYVGPYAKMESAE